MKHSFQNNVVNVNENFFKVQTQWMENVVMVVNVYFKLSDLRLALMKSGEIIEKVYLLHKKTMNISGLGWMVL